MSVSPVICPHCRIRLRIPPHGPAHQVLPCPDCHVALDIQRSGGSVVVAAAAVDRHPPTAKSTTARRSPLGSLGGFPETLRRFGKSPQALFALVAAGLMVIVFGTVLRDALRPARPVALIAERSAPATDKNSEPGNGMGGPDRSADSFADLELLSPPTDQPTPVPLPTTTPLPVDAASSNAEPPAPLPQSPLQPQAVGDSGKRPITGSGEETPDIMTHNAPDSGSPESFDQKLNDLLESLPGASPTNPIQKPALVDFETAQKTQLLSIRTTKPVTRREWLYFLGELMDAFIEIPPDVLPVAGPFLDETVAVKLTDTTAGEVLRLVLKDSEFEVGNTPGGLVLQHRKAKFTGQ